MRIQNNAIVLGVCYFSFYGRMTGVFDIKEDWVNLCFLPCFILIPFCPLVFTLGCAEIETFSPELPSYSRLVEFSAEYVYAFGTTMLHIPRLAVVINNFRGISRVILPVTKPLLESLCSHHCPLGW